MGLRGRDGSGNVSAIMRWLLPTACVWTASAVLVASSAAAGTTETNVLQNISLDLTIYQQGATNAAGTKVSDKVSTFHTKDLINALAAANGTNFGTNPKLVLSTIYSTVTNVIGQAQYSTNFSTNLPLTGALLIGSAQFYTPFSDEGVITIYSNVIEDFPGTITTNVVSSQDNTNESVVINTNAGFATIITPSTNNSGQVTNANILLLQQSAPAPTQVLLTNTSSTIGVLYGADNSIFPVDTNISFTMVSPEIVVETGNDLETTNALTVSNLSSQSAVSLQTLTINYTTPGSTNNMDLTLTGFVRQSLKVDRIGKTVVEDIFGANSVWNAVGTGFAGGNLATNTNFNTIFLSNAYPIVVEGSVNVTFLKNVVQ